MTPESFKRAADAVERAGPEECLAFVRMLASKHPNLPHIVKALAEMGAAESKRSLLAFLRGGSAMHADHLKAWLKGCSEFAVGGASWAALESSSPKARARIHATPFTHLRSFDRDPGVRETLVRSRIFMLDDRCFQSYGRFTQKLLAQPPEAMRAYLSQPLALPFDRVLLFRPDMPITPVGGARRIAVAATRQGPDEWTLHPFDLSPELRPPSLRLATSRNHVVWDGGELRFKNSEYGKPGEPETLPVDGLSSEDRTLLLVYWLFNHFIPKMRGATCREMRLERPVEATVPDSWGAKARFVNDRYILVTKPKASEPVAGVPVSFPAEYACRWEVRGHWRRTRYLGKDPTGAYVEDGRTWVRPHVKGPEGKPLVKRARLVTDVEAEHAA